MEPRDRDKPIECPRCGEADQRADGVNVCGLCECRFFVQPNVLPHPIGRWGVKLTTRGGYR